MLKRTGNEKNEITGRSHPAVNITTRTGTTGTRPTYTTTKRQNKRTTRSGLNGYSALRQKKEIHSGLASTQPVRSFFVAQSINTHEENPAKDSSLR